MVPVYESHGRYTHIFVNMQRLNMILRPSCDGGTETGISGVIIVLYKHNLLIGVLKLLA